MENTIDGKTFNEFMATEIKEWEERAKQLKIADGQEEGEFAHFFDTLPREQAVTNFCEACIMHSQRVRRIADAWEAVIGDESEPMHRLAMSYSLLARMPFAPDGIPHAMQYIKEVTHAIKYC